jgi:hypothetical protein
MLIPPILVSSKSTPSQRSGFAVERLNDNKQSFLVTRRDTP